MKSGCAATARRKGCWSKRLRHRKSPARRAAAATALRPVGRVDDKLGDHAVVIGRHDRRLPRSPCRAARLRHAEAARRVMRPGDGAKPRSGSSARMRASIAWPCGTMSCCSDAERIAARDFELQPDEVDAGDHFRDRMLDLDARVDLHEIEIVALDVVEKLDRAGVAVADRGQKIDRRLVQPRSRRVSEAPRRAPPRPSSDTGAAASNRARRNAARGRRRDRGLALRRGERARRSARYRACRRRKLPWPRSRRARTRPPATLASRATTMPRPPPPADALVTTGNPISSANATASAARSELLAARRHRDARRFGEAAGRQLVAHRLDGLRGRARRRRRLLLAKRGERQHVPTGSHSRGAGRRSRSPSRRGRSGVGQGRNRERRRPDHDHAVRFARGHAVAIRGRCGKHRLDSKSVRGAHDPQRDLAAIGDQDAPQRHGARLRPARSETAADRIRPVPHPPPTLCAQRPRRRPATEVKSFITSIRQSSVSASTVWPTVT